MESNLVQAEFADPDMILVGGIQPNLMLGAMMSPKDFSGFIKHFVDDLGKTYGNLRFHSCGTSKRGIPLNTS